MKVFIDTNVFLDHILNRSPHAQSATQLFIIAQSKQVEAYTSAISVSNLIYVLKKSGKTKNEIVNEVAEMLTFIKLLSVDADHFINAFASHFIDLEDGVQYYTALASGNIDYFITQNLKDYRHAHSDLPVVTPYKFIKEEF